MTRRPCVLSLAAAGLLGAAAPAVHAQHYAPPSERFDAQVTVDLGPALAAKADRIGRRELNDLRRDLARSASEGIARSRGAFRAAHLVLLDAKPNRPTFEQMGREPGLSMRSIAVGGARIGGFVVTADGRRVPVRCSWYETDLRNERGAATWSDADRAFDILAQDLAQGRVPNREIGQPSGSGDFGDRFR